MTISSSIFEGYTLQHQEMDQELEFSAQVHGFEPPSALRDSMMLTIEL